MRVVASIHGCVEMSKSLSTGAIDNARMRKFESNVQCALFRPPTPFSSPCIEDVCVRLD